MNSTERVRNVILGKPVDRQPIYCWTGSRIKDKICSKWGSIEAFQDHYEFDMAHIFGGPRAFKQETLDKIMAEEGEITLDILLGSDYYNPPDDPQCFEAVKRSIAFHKERERFCYVQTHKYAENRCLLRPKARPRTRYRRWCMCDQSYPRSILFRPKARRYEWPDCPVE